MQKASTRILYDYWNGLRGTRSAPDRRDIDPTCIRSALSNTFILEVDGEDGFRFRLAGAHLCSAYARELKGRSFTNLWAPRDRDAVGTLIRAVTEDHAAALVTFQGTNEAGDRILFELLLLPLRHNGNTQSRLLGALTAIEEPYWFGLQPILEQRIAGLRLIWPDEMGTGATVLVTSIPSAAPGQSVPIPAPATVNGLAARRYAHLAVIDGDRN